MTFKEHIAKTARSCRFALHNIRKIRPFLTEHAAQLLVQALVISRLDCNALLAGLPSSPASTFGRASQGVNWSWSQIKSHHTQTSSGKGLLSHFWNRNIVRSILPGLRRKITGLLLSGPKSSFQMEVNFAFNLEIKVPESGESVERHRIHVAWSPVWRSHSQWWFGLPCHLLVFSEVHSQRSHLPGNCRELHASFCWQALWRCWFHFPAGLGTCPHCQRYQKLVQWPWCYCAWLASKLAWPEPHRASMGYCQEEDERHQIRQCRTLRPLSKQPGLPLHMRSATGWLPPCNAALMQ